MEEQVKLLHKCGACKQTFDTEQEYLEHVCPTTDLTPKHPDHPAGSKAQANDVNVQSEE